MAANRQLALTALECKGLWLYAVKGSEYIISEEQDLALDAAAERALDKLWRAHMGMGRNGSNNNPVAGKPTDHLFKKKAS